MLCLEACDAEITGVARYELPATGTMLCKQLSEQWRQHVDVISASPPSTGSHQQLATAVKLQQRPHLEARPRTALFQHQRRHTEGVVAADGVAVGPRPLTAPAVGDTHSTSPRYR